MPRRKSSSTVKADEWEGETDPTIEQLLKLAKSQSKGMEGLERGHFARANWQLTEVKFKLTAEGPTDEGRTRWVMLTPGHYLARQDTDLPEEFIVVWAHLDSKPCEVAVPLDRYQKYMSPVDEGIPGVDFEDRSITEDEGAWED